MLFRAQNLSIGGILGLATLVGVLSGCPDNSGHTYARRRPSLPHGDRSFAGVGFDPGALQQFRFALRLWELAPLDQEAFDALLEAGDGPVTAAVPDVALEQLTIRSFASDPVLLPDETPLLGWLHRRDTGLFGAQVSDTQLACLNPEENGCGHMSDSELMPENPARPFTTGNRLWVPHLASAEASVFAKSGDDEAWAHERTVLTVAAHRSVGATTASSLSRLWFAGALPGAQVQAGLPLGPHARRGRRGVEMEGTLEKYLQTHREHLR